MPRTDGDNLGERRGAICAAFRERMHTLVDKLVDGDDRDRLELFLLLEMMPSIDDPFSYETELRRDR